MIIDTSAVIAIVNHERDHASVRQALVRAPILRMGAPTHVEAGAVLVSRLGLRGLTVLARFIQENRIEISPFTDLHSDIAIDAYKRFGKGRHPASLNLGDCHTYATARLAREPLLFVGNDFSQTDLDLVDLEQHDED